MRALCGRAAGSSCERCRRTEILQRPRRHDEFLPPAAVVEWTDLMFHPLNPPAVSTATPFVKGGVWARTNAPFETAGEWDIRIPPFEKGGPGGIYSYASIQPTTQRKGSFSASETYRRRAKVVGSPAPKADLRRAVLQTKTNRQLYRRFLCACRANGCRSGWLATLRSPASRTRHTSHCILEAAKVTSAAVHRQGGFAGAGFSCGKNISSSEGEKFPLTPPKKRPLNPPLPKGEPFALNCLFRREVHKSPLTSFCKGGTRIIPQHQLRKGRTPSLARAAVDSSWRQRARRKRIQFAGLEATIADVLVRVQMGDGTSSTTLVRSSQPLERSFPQLEIRWSRWTEALPGYAVGSLAAFWTIHRIAILLGGIR